VPTFSIVEALDVVEHVGPGIVSRSLVESDPTIRVGNPPRPKNDGFPAWSEEDIATYEARWPIGTRQRVWLDVLVYTGLRRGDAVRLGRPHVRNGVAT
jgi:integrase